jgi:GNAT superfamily N-acetyltransferase
MSDAPVIRTLAREEIEPHIPTLLEDGFTPEIDQGVWLGAFVDGTLAGFLRVFDEHGAWMLEDVYVLPAHRRRGLARALIDEARRERNPLWLICDDPMIGYYETLGFSLRPKEEFPASLASLYRDKREWPEAADHNHNAMRWLRP